MEAARILTNSIKAMYITSSKHKILIGISGAQGIGKTTLSRKVVQELNVLGFRALHLSIDDFYLSLSELSKMKDAKLYKYRGNPGTHNVELLVKVINELLCQLVKEVELPRFDKSLNNGLGDSVLCTVPVDNNFQIIILEGWFVGFKPIDNFKAEADLINQNLCALNAQYRITDVDLKLVNHNLRQYEKVWNILDGLILLNPLDLNYVFRWRTQQEPKDGLKPEQIVDFVDRFIPAYNLYLPSLARAIINDKYHVRFCSRLDFDQHRNVVGKYNTW